LKRRRGGRYRRSASLGDPKAEPLRLNVVLNWDKDLERLVPVKR
jgi:hypothetical protein